MQHYGMVTFTMQHYGTVTTTVQPIQHSGKKNPLLGGLYQNNGFYYISKMDLIEDTLARLLKTLIRVLSA